MLLPIHPLYFYIGVGRHSISSSKTLPSFSVFFSEKFVSSTVVYTMFFHRLKPQGSAMTHISCPETWAICEALALNNIAVQPHTVF